MSIDWVFFKERYDSCGVCSFWQTFQIAFHSQLEQIQNKGRVIILALKNYDAHLVLPLQYITVHTSWITKSLFKVTEIPRECIFSLLNQRAIIQTSGACLVSIKLPHADSREAIMRFCIIYNLSRIFNAEHTVIIILS
jgi:hypothetical protein